MTIFFKYFFFLILLFAAACNEPGPTELVREETEDFDIEILSPDPDIIPGNYDSTGIVQNIPRFANIISVNGIKNTFGSNTQTDYYASAEFYDRSDTVRSRNRRMLGFNLRALGRVKFGDLQAKMVHRRIRYLFNGTEIDTTLGIFHELRGRGHGMGGPGPGGPMPNIDFPYDSKVKFELDPFIGEATSFNIPTPTEISGRIRVLGSTSEKNLRLELSWDNDNNDRVDIVVGGFVDQQTSVPFYRIKNVRNDGELTIPKELMKNIPFDRFKMLIISFEHVKEFRFSNSTLSDNLITSKSIHNIRFNVP